MHRFLVLRAPLVCLVALLLAASAPRANDIPQSLPFTQDWTDEAVIPISDDWLSVPGVIGYRGDGLTTATGVDPQSVVGVGTPVVDVNANQTSPNTFTTGGVAEFHAGTNTGGNAVVALSGSGTARAPHIVLTLNTTGLFNITINYNLRDLDGSADNAISPVALQFRVGEAGDYTNASAGFVSDASAGPSLAGLVTPVSVVLPAEVSNQPVVQIRIITTDAVGSDEWIGIDDIDVSGSPIALPTNPAGVGAATPSTVAPGETATLSVVVSLGQNPTSSGVTVTGDLSSIGGSSAQAFAFQGGLTFAHDVTVAAGTADGTKTLPITITDAEGRTGSASISLNVFTPPPPVTSVTISQVYGGGGNSGATFTHDFIELFNKSASAVDVTGWSVQYASSGGSTWQTTALSGTIQPGRYYLVQQAAGAGGSLSLPAPNATGSIPMSATAGKVALVASTPALTGSCPTGSPIVDFVGFGATANCFEGPGPAPAPSNTNAIHRAGGGAIDTENNAADFAAAVPTPRNGSGIPPRGVGTASPGVVDSGDVSLLAVTVTPGAFPSSTTVTVTGNLTTIGGSSAQPFVDNGTNGDLTAGDNVFSYLTTVTGTQGSKSITATVGDDLGRTSSTQFSVVIAAPPVPIHQIQGPGTISSYEGQLVTTTGIVTALRSSSFYIQTPDALVDTDPGSSEGLLVFSGFPRPGGFTVGDLVRVTGTITEFRPAADPGSPTITELINPVVTMVSSGHPLPTPATLLPAFTVPGGNFEQLERFEGMRVRADITAISGTSAFNQSLAEEQAAISVSNGDFFAVLTGVARPMREPGLEPGQPDFCAGSCLVPRFDGNPERLRVDSDGQIGSTKIEIVAGQAITGLTGVLDYGFRSYTIVPDPVVWTLSGRGDALPVPAASANEFTVASFNMQRFYDTTDDEGVDDVALTVDGYARRLSKASLAIRNVLRMPDVLGVQEMDSLSTLQAVAARVNADAVLDGQPNPLYVAYLAEGNDPGGIDVGVLVKSARLDVVGVTQVGLTTTYVQPNGSTALLNDRPPLVLEAAVRAAGATPYRITVIVNHLRSLNGIDGSDGARVRSKRRAQAEFLANYIQARQAADPTERIISVGDYNAFPFNDGYVDMIGTIKGQPTPADQVAAPSGDLVNPDLTNLGDSLAADQYSYVFDGNAQTIDHVLVNEAARRRFSRMAYARSNADFPESLRSDPTRPERLSDHDMPVAYFVLPGVPVITLNGPATMTVEVMSGFVDPGATATDEELGAVPVTVTGFVDARTVGTYVLTYSATNGFRTATVSRTVHVVDTTAPTLSAIGATPSFIAVPNHSMIDVVLTYTATDATGTPACSIGITSNEAANAQGDGNTEIDWEVLSATQVRVRAERSGLANGRIYTISVTCVDAAGNSVTKTANVVVNR